MTSIRNRCEGGAAGIRALAFGKQRGEYAGIIEDRQRNWPRSATGTNLKTMHLPISYAVSHPHNINPAARNVATNIDGTLDRAAVQKNAICSFQAITAASI